MFIDFFVRANDCRFSATKGETAENGRSWKRHKLRSFREMVATFYWAFFDDLHENKMEQLKILFMRSTFQVLTWLCFIELKSKFLLSIQFRNGTIRPLPTRVKWDLPDCARARISRVCCDAYFAICCAPQFEDHRHLRVCNTTYVGYVKHTLNARFIAYFEFVRFSRGVDWPHRRV